MTLSYHQKNSISTHTLRKEGDYINGKPFVGTELFQPTPSARRVTLCTSILLEQAIIFQPTPSARRVTIARALLRVYSYDISTHTLRKEGDAKKENGI